MVCQGWSGEKVACINPCPQPQPHGRNSGWILMPSLHQVFSLDVTPNHNNGHIG